MASPDSRLAQGDGGAPPITLVYVRPGELASELDDRLREVAERYAPLVEVRTVAELPRELGSGHAADSGPVLFIVRRGQVIGEAMGSLLPARELDRVVRRAVEWLDRAA